MRKDTPFSDFAEVCERLQKTAKRLEKKAKLAEFLRSLNQVELPVACLLILGKVFPSYDARTIDVSWRTLQKVFNELTKNAAPSSLTITEVYRYFEKIAETSGPGSRKKILDLLRSMFNQTNDIEKKYLSKIIFGEMRIGVAEGLLLESIATAANISADLIRRANMYLGDPGEVAFIALYKSEKEVREVRLQLFRPVQPMLAELAEDFEKILQSHGGQTAFEFKLDGARVQIHKRRFEVKIYSRHLTDVTPSLPDVVEIVKSSIKANEVIVEGEVVAFGKDGRPFPFQELMRRFRRVHNIEKLSEDVPIKLYLFDFLLLNGKPYVESEYSERFQLLEKNCPQEILVDRIVTADKREAQSFLNKSLDAGHEGLMAKRLDSIYLPGARGKKWFKIKPAETLDLVVVAADWGSGRRVGWLSNYHLAAREESSGRFLLLGKTFKGLTDAQFKWMTEKLCDLKIKETKYTVYVKPEVVVEVAYNEIQRSPQYDSGFALRFARIKKIRADKKTVQADTIERLRKLYKLQFKRKAKITTT